MLYYAIYETATGRLVSLGNVLGDHLPDNLTVIDIGTAPDLRLVVWDEGTRTFIQRPAKVLVDRLDDLRAQPGMTAFWNSLTGAQKTVLANALITVFGKLRYRAQYQPVSMGPED